MKTIDSFIEELKMISEEKRKLPLVITCQNGIQAEPEIKQQFKKYQSPLTGDKPEKMVICY